MNYKNLIFIIIILFVVGFIYNKINYYISYQEKKDDLNLIKKYLLEDDKNIEKIVNNKRPKIWIYLNHEINSYKWIDFGSRNSKIEWTQGMSIEDIVHALDMQHWIGQGLAVALNGERCPLDIHPQQGDEVALLPPVSGG